MFRSTENGKRVLGLMDAFARDDFEVVKIVIKFNRVGIAAECKSVTNYDTGRRKKAYYIEGSGYEMGFLLGSLAESEIASMAVEFTDKVVFSFIGSKLLEKMKLLQEAFILLIYELSKKVYAALPQELKDEIQGLFDGCKSVNPGTKVSMEHLIVLNTGVDILCSMVYTGNFSFRGLAGIEPEDVRIPLMCNAFSVSGRSAGNGHYFGRDFMFPTADVFQDTAAMILYNPLPKDGKKAIPFVGVTAPGIVGSISAMNIKKTAAGVDMSPAANCEPQKIGVNSLLLVRLCVQEGDSAEAAARVISETPRGVSWNYIIADGNSGRACVAEAGSSGPAPDIMQFPPEDVRPFLPSKDLSVSGGSGNPYNGVMLRWNDYSYPVGYLDYNSGLWEYYNKKHSTQSLIYPDAFAGKGFINKNNAETNCPSTFYFAPQRETNDSLVLATNHYIIPEMRYYSMHPWTSWVVGGIVNDIQWRYDELNKQLSDTIESKGYIGYEAARDLISFLSPYGKYPGYYNGNPKSRDGKEIRIEGCVSLFDLKNLTVESHYGYFCDKWVKLSLPNYFNGIS